MRYLQRGLLGKKHDSASVKYIFDYLKNSKYSYILERTKHIIVPFNSSDDLQAIINQLLIDKYGLREWFNAHYFPKAVSISQDKIKKLTLVLRLLWSKRLAALRFIYSYLQNRQRFTDKKEVLVHLAKYIFASYFKKAVLFDFKDHHLCHAASAYYFSPFNGKKALVFTIDGFGDNKFSTLYWWEGRKYDLITFSEMLQIANHGFVLFDRASIGILYSLFTLVLGFKPLSDEGKTEALVVYGEPNKELYGEISKAIRLDRENLR